MGRILYAFTNWAIIRHFPHLSSVEIVDASIVSILC